MNEKKIKIQVENPKSIKLILTGDVHLATNYHQKMAASSKKKFHLHDVTDFTYLTTPFFPLFNSADFVIANLETPVLNEELPRYYGDLKQYYHRDFPDLIFSVLEKLNVKAITLANNHILDYGPDGLLKTLEYLKDKKLPYIGAGKDFMEAKRALFVDFTKDNQTILKVAILSAFEYRKKYHEVYDFYANKNKSGVNKLTRRILADHIKDIKQNDPERFVIFYPHWGKDYQWVTSQQEHSAEAIVEAGVNLIIGHGSHFSQNIVYLNNVPVVYGLGNFIFLTPGGFRNRPEIPSIGLVAQLNFNLNEKKPKFDTGLKLYPLQANNRITLYQPRFANKQEVFETFTLFLDKSHDKKEFQNQVKTETDEFGEYFNLKLP
jgi:UDP-N-acetylmuramoyl-tripeptide--D-alanyl-D-alanine ligase/cyanophycin synthetase/poly-gamma-glutamate synthesis protein (capsule biosynthesis protein)